MKTTNSFKDLPNLIKATGGVSNTDALGRKRREFKRTKPVYVRLLNDKINNLKKVAELVGVSDAAIGEGIRTDDIGVSIELAAKLRYQELFPQEKETESGDMVFVSMLIHKDAMKQLKPHLESAEIKFKIF